MTDNAAIIRDFVAAWSRLDPAELAAYFTEDGSYHNMPIDPVTGREAIQGFIAAFIDSWTATDWDIISLVADGDTVICERVDRTRSSAGDVDLPCVGVFEIRDGKIHRWRDYFDMATYAGAMAG